MALIALTSLDIVGQTQTITFSNPSQVDQITYSSNSITFQTSTGYSLSKSDLLLYFQYLIAFNVLLGRNFPVVNLSTAAIFPLCNFSLTETSQGVTHIVYNQTSSGTTVMNINYLPVAVSGAFTTRSSPVTITLQEFFMFINMITQYAVQVNLN